MLLWNASLALVKYVNNMLLEHLVVGYMSGDDESNLDGMIKNTVT